MAKTTKNRKYGCIKRKKKILANNLQRARDAKKQRDEWMSCQTDANKLVQPSLRKIDEDYFTVNEPSILTKVSPNERPEEVQLSLIEESQPDSLQEIKLYSEEIPKSPISDNNFTHDDDINLEPDMDEWFIKKQLCRCCLAEGTFDSLTSIATGGEDISYDDILLSFSIELFPVEAAARGALRGVCGLCAARLRDAHAFRHQVHASDARFRALYTRNCITVDMITSDVKLEETADVNDDFDQESNEMNTQDQPLLDLDQESNEINSKDESLGNLNKESIEINTTDQPLLIEKKNKSTTQARKSANKSQKREPLKKKEISEPAKTSNKSTKKTRKNAREALPIVSHEYYYLVGDRYKCKRCNLSKGTATKLEDHFKKVHLKMPHLKCEHCDGPSFKLLRSLLIHKLQEHNIDERHKCGACDKRFYLQYELNEHVNSYHMLGEIIKCTKCDFESYSKAIIRKHMFKHRATKDYHCKYCKKSFLRKTNLQLHERIHTGDKRKACAECGQAFVQKASLNYHMAKYHPEVKF